MVSLFVPSRFASKVLPMGLSMSLQLSRTSRALGGALSLSLSFSPNTTMPAACVRPACVVIPTCLMSSEVPTSTLFFPLMNSSSTHYFGCVFLLPWFSVVLVAKGPPLLHLSQTLTPQSPVSCRARNRCFRRVRNTRFGAVAPQWHVVALALVALG